MQERPTTGTDSKLDDEAPASPADALAIIEREQARREPDIGPFFVIWGTVWAVIGLGWFGAAFGTWSTQVAVIATIAAIVAAGVLTGVVGARLNRGVDGPSQSFGALYGVAWTIAMVGTGVLVGGLARFGGPGVGVLAPALFVFVAGALYTVGGAFWHSRLDYGLGITLQAIALVSVFTPVPWNSLLMGVAGGGALIAVGVLRRVRR